MAVVVFGGTSPPRSIPQLPVALLPPPAQASRHPRNSCTTLDPTCSGPRPKREALLESRRRQRVPRPGADGDDVLIDCTSWRLCPHRCCTSGAMGAGTQRRLNFTVGFVLCLFAFIWTTVVFAAVRFRRGR